MLTGNATHAVPMGQMCRERHSPFCLYALTVVLFPNCGSLSIIPSRLDMIKSHPLSSSSCAGGSSQQPSVVFLPGVVYFPQPLPDCTTEAVCPPLHSTPGSALHQSELGVAGPQHRAALKLPPSGHRGSAAPNLSHVYQMPITLMIQPTRCVCHQLLSGPFLLPTLNMKSC